MTTLTAPIGTHNYAATGTLGSLQAALLTPANVDRLLGAHSGEEVESIFTELKFTDAIDQGLSTGEEILPALGAWVKNETNKLASKADEAVFSIAWFKADSALLSYYLKKKLGLTTAVSEPPKPTWSTYTAEQYAAQVNDEPTADLPAHVARFIGKITSQGGITGQQVDTEVTKFFMSESLALAKVSGDPFILRYVKDLVNLNNLKSIKRDFSAEVRRESFVAGGDIPMSFLNTDPDDILEALTFCRFPAHLGNQLRNVTSVTDFEQATLDIERYHLATMWNQQFSLASALAFATIALSHIAFLRSVLIAKRNDFSSEECKRLTPILFPAAHY